MVAFWKDACDEGVLAWDDTNNNRAFHANEISATLNGASILHERVREGHKVRCRRTSGAIRDAEMEDVRPHRLRRLVLDLVRVPLGEDVVQWTETYAKK
jgi:hypothetical protein